MARGDPHAIDDCLLEYGGLVWGLATRYLGPRSGEIEDRVQDAFVHLWKNAAKFDPARGSEPAFVATLTHRLLIDHLRRTGARAHVTQAPSLAEAKPHGSAVGSLPAELRAAREAFSRLGRDEQEVLRLWLHHGLSHERIAGVVSIPVGTVKSRLRRGMLRLREMLATPGGEVSR